MLKPEDLSRAIEKGFSDGFGEGMRDHRHHPVRHNARVEYTERHVPILLDMIARGEMTVDHLQKLKLTREAIEEILRRLEP